MTKNGLSHPSTGSSLHWLSLRWLTNNKRKFNSAENCIQIRWKLLSIQLKTACFWAENFIKISSQNVEVNPKLVSKKGSGGLVKNFVHFRKVLSSPKFSLVSIFFNFIAQELWTDSSLVAHWLLVPRDHASDPGGRNNFSTSSFELPSHDCHLP